VECGGKLSNQEVSTDVIDALRKYDSPTISNVIELFDVRPLNAGYVDSTITALFPEMPAVFGFASTATVRASSSAEKGSQASFRSQMEALSKLPAPRIVVFQDLDSPPAAATFGEVMCSVYQRFGCVAVLTSGAGRDLDAIRKLGFPAFASSVCVSHGYSHFEEVHGPVQVGGLTIHPGDLIHADPNGIVVIPTEIAREVAQACQAYIESEQVILNYLKKADVNIEGLQGAFDQHGINIVAIPKRFRTKSSVPAAENAKNTLI
jgi:4-hydroxy-4-methyl-2-oxoglutarate aldolase